MNQEKGRRAASQAEITWRRLHSRSGSQGCKRINFSLECCRRKAGQLEFSSEKRIRVSSKNYFKLFVFVVL